MQTQVLNDHYVACPFQIQMCDLQGGFSLTPQCLTEPDCPSCAPDL